MCSVYQHVHVIRYSDLRDAMANGLFSLEYGFPSEQPGDKTGSSPLPFLPSRGPEDILSSEDSSSLLSTLSITVSPSYSGQVNLSELALPDNVPVLTDHQRESSSLTDSEVSDVKGGGAPLIRVHLNHECMQTSTCVYVHVHPLQLHALYMYIARLHVAFTMYVFVEH